MLPHGAQGSWEGPAIYLAKELRDTRIRVNAADPGYTATDFNAVRAGEVADFRSGAPAAGRGCPTTRAESLGRSLRLTRGLVVAQALLATRIPEHCPRNSSAPAAVDHPDERGIDGVTRQ
jgi:NAD(P)-dependent dehydrogenase (short-subunit alcohol dehydrogenase family)